MLTGLIAVALAQASAPLEACVRASDALVERSTPAGRVAAIDACSALFDTSCRAAWRQALKRPEPERRADLASVCRPACDAGNCDDARLLAASELRALYRGVLTSRLGAARADDAMAALEALDHQNLGFPFSRACTQEPGVPKTTAPSLDPTRIREVIRAALPRLRSCITEDTATLGPLSFTIGADGRVCSVRGEATAEQPARRCLHRALEQLVFPPPPGGGVIVVSYPLNVDPVE